MGLELWLQRENRKRSWQEADIKGKNGEASPTVNDHFGQLENSKGKRLYVAMMLVKVWDPSD